MDDEDDDDDDDGDDTFGSGKSSGDGENNPIDKIEDQFPSKYSHCTNKTFISTISTKLQFKLAWG